MTPNVFRTGDLDIRTVAVRREGGEAGILRPNSPWSHMVSSVARRVIMATYGIR